MTEVETAFQLAMRTVATELDDRMTAVLDQRDRLAMSTALAKMFAAGARAGIGEMATLAAQHNVHIKVDDQLADVDVWSVRYGGEA